MIEVLAPVLGASLLGSPHCAAMCGGFVCFYSGSGRVRLLSHVAYNGGRLISYVVLGALAGMFGAGLDRAGAAFGLGRVAAIASGAFLLVWGIGMLLAAFGARMPATPGSALAHRSIGRVLRHLADRPPAVRALAIGLLTTLLPCGFLHVFVASAAGTASPVQGALFMSAFWLGTVPVMGGLGALAQRVLTPFRARLPLASAATLIVIGILTLAGKLPFAAAAAGAGHACH